MEWDVIVLGLGGVGSSTVCQLASRGQRVLGIEQYSPAHQYGSSHGKTRIIRQAYFEDPSYVPMLCRAYDLWDQLQNASSQSLFVRCGLAELGPTDGVLIPGVLASAKAFDLPVERLTPQQVASRWPGIQSELHWQALVETNAGFLQVEDCIRAQLRVAQQAGADCRFGVTASGWRVDGSGVCVLTSSGPVHAASLVLAGGSWSSQLLGSLSVPLQVLRKHVYWFETDREGFTLQDSFPCFFHETTSGCYYGFPAIDSLGVKVARHSGGQPIAGPDESPRPVDLDEEDLNLVNAYVRRYLPGVSTRLSARAACYYTSTPDEHFVIDRHPEFPQVTVVAGLSGHGFKFTSVLGEIAAGLAMGETPAFDLSLFRIDRFASTRSKGERG